MGNETNVVPLHSVSHLYTSTIHMEGQRQAAVCTGIWAEKYLVDKQAD
jgi:hypothetical protein